MKPSSILVPLPHPYLWEATGGRKEGRKARSEGFVGFVRVRGIQGLKGL
jgi:hypothetical protein